MLTRTEVHTGEKWDNIPRQTCQIKFISRYGKISNRLWNMYISLKCKKIFDFNILNVHPKNHHSLTSSLSTETATMEGPFSLKEHVRLLRDRTVLNIPQDPDVPDMRELSSKSLFKGLRHTLKSIPAEEESKLRTWNTSYTLLVVSVHEWTMLF